MKRINSVLIAGILAAASAACSSSATPTSPTIGGSGAETGSAARPGTLNIVQIVQQDSEFDVLEAAVVRAGLVEALSGNRQLTVFAPNDLAFVTTLQVADEAAAIAAIDELPLGTLQDILLYHVTSGRRSSTSVLAAPSYQMLNGGTLTRETLSAAGILATDISASNGIVHVIGRVLLP